MKPILLMLVCAAALLAGDHTGRRAPGFALPDSKFAVYDLADYHGKVVILEFTQTTCVPCNEFSEVLKKAHEFYGDKIAILAVANAKRENTESVARYVIEHRIPYPVVFDEGQMSYSYFLKFSYSSPYVFIIDGNGVIRNDYGYSPFTRNLFEAKGLFAEIDRVLNSPLSVAPRK